MTFKRLTEQHLAFLGLEEATKARLNLHIVVNHMSRLIFREAQHLLYTVAIFSRDQHSF